MRGFQNVTGFDVKLPERGTSHSAGYDICSAEDTVLEVGDTVVLKTGLKAYMAHDEVPFVSGISCLIPMLDRIKINSTSSCAI